MNKTNKLYCKISSIEKPFDEWIFSRLDGVEDLKRREILYAIRHPYNNEQLDHQRYLADVHQLTKVQIKNRAVIVYTSLAQYYRKRAQLDRYE